MANVLCLEPIGGIAGDMFLALAIDLGVDKTELQKRLALLGLPDWHLEVSRATRHAIVGSHVDVIVSENSGEECETKRGDDSHGSESQEHHAHSHHGHSHDHEHSVAEHDHRSHHHHRSFRDIKRIIANSGLESDEKNRALSIFGLVAAAESKVHGIPIDEISFHEVGAIDSIVDIVGASIVIGLLGNPEIYCAPLPMGSGIGKRAHGMMPIPPPATIEILKGRAISFVGKGELTTPTGAAIVAAMSKEAPFPELVLEKVGYGVGTCDFADRPNVLRGLLGKTSPASNRELFVLETNLDDASPQTIAFAVEKLLGAGALDAWVAPLTMKKGRPGHLLGVLAEPEKRELLTEIILRQTTTLGVRAYSVERTILDRKFETVETAWGPVRIKIGSLRGEQIGLSPEYEDCAKIARESGASIKEVMAAALALSQKK